MGQVLKKMLQGVELSVQVNIYKKLALRWNDLCDPSESKNALRLEVARYINDAVALPLDSIFGTNTIFLAQVGDAGLQDADILSVIEECRLFLKSTPAIQG